MQRSSITRAVRFALYGLAAPGLAMAQSGQNASDEELQEIIVYGQAKQYRPKEQTSATGLRLSLIDTPQSISVISEEMLDIAGGRSAYEAVDMVPGVHKSGTGFATESLQIRGQSAGAPRINGIDAYSSSYLDSYVLERLEVVRGPATVVYGVTVSFGGEINQILKAAGENAQAEFGFEAGDFDRQRFEADVGGPVPGTDGRLKARFVGTYTDAGLYQDTVVDTNNLDKLYYGTATWDVTPSTSASIYMYRQDRDLDPADGCTLLQDEDNVLSIPRSIPFERFYCGDPKQAHSTLTNDFVMGALHHTFGNDWYFDGKVTASNTERFLDYVYGFGPAGAFALGPDEIYLLTYTERVEDDTVTASLSLGGDFELMERTHQFLAALEYQSGEFTSTNYLSTGLGYLDMLEDGGKGILNDGSPIPLIPPDVLFGVAVSDIAETRASAQVLLHPTDRLQVLAGALVQRTELDVVNNLEFSPATTDRLRQTDWVGRFGLTYELFSGGERLSAAKVYYSYSEGFEPNVGIFDIDGNPLTDPQDMTSHEVGIKAEWLNGAVGSSLALYDAELTNVPATAFGEIGESGTFSSVLDGKRDYRGVEFELVGEILPGWNAIFAYAFTDTEVFSPLIPQRLAIANVPRHQASIYTSYEFLAGPLDGLIVGASVVHREDSPLLDNAFTIFEMGYDPNDQVLDSTTRFDFRASYTLSDGRFDGLEIFGRVYNAFDEKEYFSISGHPGFTNTLGPPRQVTVGIRYEFDI
jgi:outer membrane receptor for ferric coprogen and ferric-rhodotorulic acid